VVHDAIKKYDGNHLILGCRYIYPPPDEVLKGSIGYTDVISINVYTDPYYMDILFHNDLSSVLDKIYGITALPVMITEFSVRAEDSGLPNTIPTKGVVVTVETQSNRAQYYEEYVERFLSKSFIVGYRWFEYIDEPAKGRSPDGENSNFGLVNINDEPWTTLVERARFVNLLAECARI
jgi:hypothetical protein